MLNVDFEKSINRLEEIAKRLESGELSLLDAIKYYEEGVILSKICEKELDNAEQKIEYLNNFEIPENISEVIGKINPDLVINKNEENNIQVEKGSKKKTIIDKVEKLDKPEMNKKNDKKAKKDEVIDLF